MHTMTTTVTDFYGRVVEDLVICACCGQAIKTAFRHEGKVYGSKCIKKFLGFDKDFAHLVVDKAGNVDLEATKAKVLTNAQIDATNRLIDLWSVRKSNSVKVVCAVVEDMFKHQRHGFMADMLDRFYNGTTVDHLSPKQLAILKKTWCETLIKNGGQVIVGLQIEGDSERHQILTISAHNMDEAAILFDRYCVPTPVEGLN